MDETTCLRCGFELGTACPRCGAGTPPGAPECDACGQPLCPDCGAEMTLPDEDANQAIASDENVIETLASEGIVLSEKDQELINKNL